MIHELRDGLRALDPDLVFLQEVQGLNQRFALRFAGCPGRPAARVPRRRRTGSTSTAATRCYDHGHHGNAILSRFGFVSFENEDVSDHRYERRGLLHSVVAVPGWRRNLHCVCVHLSLHERGRSRQLEAISGAAGGARLARPADHRRRRLQRLAPSRHRDPRAAPGHDRGVACRAMAACSRTYPSLLPILRLDRIYVRGFKVVSAQVHRGKPWSLLSDHLAVSAELERA